MRDAPPITAERKQRVVPTALWEERPRARVGLNRAVPPDFRSDLLLPLSPEFLPQGLARSRHAVSVESS